MNDSSLDLMYLTMLWEIGVQQAKITRKEIHLEGFNGSMKMSIGTIRIPASLPVTIVLKIFVVLDIASPYNVSLGRPWFHRQQVVPSTLY